MFGVLVLTGVAPAGVAVWVAVGAVATGLRLWWDARRQTAV